MRRLLIATATAVACLASIHAQATPYLDPVMWLNAANPGSRLSVFPGHTVVMTDGFGSYTYQQRNDPVVVGGYGDPGRTDNMARGGRATANTSAGQINGSFGCVSYVGPACLGAYDITYQLEQKVWGFAGQLSYLFPFADADDIPFFGLDRSYLSPRPADAVEYYSGFQYQGFFGEIFDTPTDTFTISWRPDGDPLLPGADNAAFFSMSGVIALIPANRPTPVPEPASFAILGVGLAGLAAASRRRRKAV